MKLENVCYDKKTFIVSIDFWEAESLGYDVKKKEDATGHFFSNVIAMIDEFSKQLFGIDYKFAIKTFIDENKGLFYYEVKPYEERLNEYILAEMSKNGRRWIFYDDQIWTV